MQWEVSRDDICSSETDQINHMTTYWYPEIQVSELIGQGRIWSPFLRRCDKLQGFPEGFARLILGCLEPLKKHPLSDCYRE